MSSEFNGKSFRTKMGMKKDMLQETEEKDLVDISKWRTA
jgi:hypothetical protein